MDSLPARWRRGEVWRFESQVAGEAGFEKTLPNSVKQVARGDAYMATAMTEPHAGSDFYTIKSNARKIEGFFGSTVKSLCSTSGAGNPW